MPLPATVDELQRFRVDRAHWEPLVAEIARSHGVGPTPLEDLGGGHLVVGLGPDRVLKLAPPAFAAELEVERLALAHVAGRLPIRTPDLHAAGARDGWSYLLLERLPGRMLYDLWPETQECEQIAILRQLGDGIAALHRLPPPEFRPGWPEFLATESAACGQRQSEWGVPSEVASLIPPLLQAAQLDRTPATPLLHADLTGQNVLADGELAITGCIDFADAQVGHPLYDLVAPGLLLARGRRDALAALLDGYGMDRSARGPELSIRLAACAALHRFNPLTRYLGWAPRPPRTIEELATLLFPI